VVAGTDTLVGAGSLLEGARHADFLHRRRIRPSAVGLPCKTESPELKALLEKVSETSKATTKELDSVAKLNPPVTLKAPHLPRLEQAARASIHKEMSKEIFHSNGVDLEFNMVSSQLAGMNYAAHLARTLAAVETNPVRREFLQRTDRSYLQAARPNVQNALCPLPTFVKEVSSGLR
jgi:hypothetical protein